MFKHGVIEILKTLSRKEINSFKKFLTSSYHGRQIVIEKLFAEIIKYYPEFNSKKLTTENLVCVVSPTGKHSTLRDSLSLLLRTLTEFLSYEQFRRDRINRNHYSLKSFVERNVQDSYEKLLKNIESDITKSSSSLMEIFFQQYRVSQLMYDNAIQNLRRKNMAAVKDEIKLLTRVFVYSLNYFISSAIRTYYDLSNYRNNFEINLSKNPVLKAFEDDTIFKIADKLKKHNSAYYIIDIYKAMHKLNLKSTDGNYRIFKGKIMRNESRLAKDEQELLYYELMKFNLVSLQTRLNKLMYEKELFVIYRKIIRRGIFIDRNEIPTDLYINILINAYKLKKSGWMEFVINNYLEKVYKVDRYNASCFSMGLLFYIKRNFEKSLEYIERIEPTNRRYNIMRRKLIIRNCIKLGLHEKALNEIRNLRGIMRRSEGVSAKTIKSNLIILKMLEDIVKEPKKSRLIKEKLNLDF